MLLKKIIVLLFVVVFAASCTKRLTDFTVISSKNVDLSKMSSYKKGGNRVIGKDVMHIIIIIPTAFGIDLKEALDNAIETTPGCVALADGVISQFGIYLLLYGQSAFIVEGTPIIDPSIGMIDSQRPYIITEMDENGKFNSRNVTELEFNNAKSQYID